jgi:DNA-binding response OmpR family regulator
MKRGEQVNKNGVVPHIAVKKSPFFTTLIGDDRDPPDMVLENFLKDDGHSVLRAVTAAGALAVTREFQPDLILLESILEGKSSLPLLPGLLLEQSAAAVIVLATHPSVSDAAEAIKMGAVDYFERPLDLTKLKAAIDLQKALFKG